MCEKSKKKRYGYNIGRKLFAYAKEKCSIFCKAIEFISMKCVCWKSLGIFEGILKTPELKNWNCSLSYSSFWLLLYIDWLEAPRTCVSSSSSSSICWSVCLSCICITNDGMYGRLRYAFFKFDEAKSWRKILLLYTLCRDMYNDDI